MIKRGIEKWANKIEERHFGNCHHMEEEFVRYVRGKE
jgi:hypothetical protein